MAILYTEAPTNGAASTAATTANAGGTLLGVSLAGAGAQAGSYQKAVLISLPSAKAHELLNAYLAQKPAGWGELSLWESPPAWASLSRDERLLALAAKVLLP